MSLPRDFVLSLYPVLYRFASSVNEILVGETRDK